MIFHYWKPIVIFAGFPWVILYVRIIKILREPVFLDKKIDVTSALTHCTPRLYNLTSCKSVCSTMNA